MSRRILQRMARSTRGAAVVEFAIVVPFLLTLLLGIIDFGRMFAVGASLAAAVREGARVAAAASDPSAAATVTAAQDRVIGAFQPLGGTALTRAAVTVSAVDVSGNVTIRVTGYTYVPITPIARFIGLGTVTLTRQAVFRWERAS